MSLQAAVLDVGRWKQLQRTLGLSDPTPLAEFRAELLATAVPAAEERAHLEQVISTALRTATSAPTREASIAHMAESVLRNGFRHEATS